MKVKKTLHEVYSEIVRLREQRDMMGQVATERPVSCKYHHL